MRLLVILMLVFHAGGCARHETADLSSEHLDLITQALRHPMTEMHVRDTVGVCLPGRSDPTTKFLQQFDSPFSLAPCPFWGNALLRKAQWNLDVYDVEVIDGAASVRILRTEPSGLHGGYYYLRYERGDSGWVLKEKIYGIP
jgi:hypothetical protein